MQLGLLWGAQLCGWDYIGRELAWLPGPKPPGARLLGPRLLGPRLLGARLLGARLLGPKLLGARLLGPRLLGPRLLGARLMTNPGLLMVLGLLLGLRLVLRGPRLPGLGIRLG